MDIVTITLLRYDLSNISGNASVMVTMSIRLPIDCWTSTAASNHTRHTRPKKQQPVYHDALILSEAHLLSSTDTGREEDDPGGIFLLGTTFLSLQREGSKTTSQRFVFRGFTERVIIVIVMVIQIVAMAIFLRPAGKRITSC